LDFNSFKCQPDDWKTCPSGLSDACPTKRSQEEAQEFAGQGPSGWVVLCSAPRKPQGPQLRRQGR
jgi:hypothetical protein